MRPFDPPTNPNEEAPMTHPICHPTLRCTLATAALLSPALALAHSGHGMEGPHWHATDAFGLVVLAAVFAAAVWWARRK